MVDTVDGVFRAGFLEENAERIRELADLVEFPGEPEVPLAEVGDVARHRLGRVALGIDTDEHDAR